MVPGFMESFKQGLEEPTGPGPYEVEGFRVRCPICGAEVFDDGIALLNTAGMTLFGFDWANREANLLHCMRCSNVLWFTKEPRRVL